MSLLTPIPALVAAAIAIPAVLALYFLKLRRRPVRVGSTLLWGASDRDAQVNVPFRVIRPSWLLLLHLLIVTLFTLALGRPAVEMAGAGAERVIIVIDRSASMSARDGPRGRTRLEEAKARALGEVDRLGRAGAARFTVVALAADARPIVPFTSDRAGVKAAIGAVEPTDQPGRLAPAADAVRAAAADEADETEAAQVAMALVFTDGAFTDARDARFGNAAARFEVVGSPAADNLGIAGLSARRDYDDPARVRVFVRIVNAGAGAVLAPLSLSLDGRVVERRVVEVPGSPAGAGPADPGEATVTLDFENTAGATAVVTIGREDALAADNAAGVVLDPPPRPRLPLVLPDGEPSPRADPGQPVGPSALVYDVLAEMTLGGIRVIDATAYAAMAGEACDADAVVFDRVAPAAAPACPTLSFGAAIPLAGLRADPGGPAAPLSWNRDHPVMRDVSLDTLYTASGLRLELLGAPGVRFTELAVGNDGPLIVLAEHAGVRRIVVAFGAADSTWPASFGFPIFLSNAVEFLTLAGEARAGRMATTGEPARVPAPGRTLVLTGPRRVEVASPASPDGTIVVPPLEIAGLYRIAGAPEGPSGALAVNLLDAAETALRVVPEPAVAAADGGIGARSTAGLREVWHWFVIAAAALLGVEWLLTAAFLRM